MKRLTFSLICVLTFIGMALSLSSVMADDGRSDNVTVSFGQWNPNDPDLKENPNAFPLDRLLADPSAGRGNNHEMFPKSVKISEGDSVSFIISGGHILAVYDDETKPKDIGSDIEPDCVGAGPFTTPCSPVNAQGPVAGGILSNPNGRIYRGPFLNVNPARRDGVEVVQFSKPGTYLVICARAAHFLNPDTQKFEMFGFVKVEKDRNKRW
jgi:hypothetical protein